MQSFLCKRLLSISICQSTLLTASSSSIALTQASQFQRDLASPSPWIVQGECLSSQESSLPGWCYTSAPMAFLENRNGHLLRSSTTMRHTGYHAKVVVHQSPIYIHKVCKSPQITKNHKSWGEICRSYRRLSVETCLEHQELSFLFPGFATFPFLRNAVSFCSLTRGLTQHPPASPNIPQQLSEFRISRGLVRF